MISSPLYSRRAMLGRLSSGFGLMALAGLMGRQSRAAATEARPKPHFAPRAKNVIFCYMSGGVSHVDSFDPKPRLIADAGKPMPVRIERTAFDKNGAITPPYWDFQKRGQSGLEVSELFPQMAARADD